MFRKSPETEKCILSLFVPYARSLAEENISCDTFWWGSLRKFDILVFSLSKKFLLLCSNWKNLELDQFF